MSDLSKLQSAARTAFRRTTMGKLVIKVKAELASGRANTESIMRYGNQMRQIGGAEFAQNLMQELGVGNSWRFIERYAGKDAWKKLLGNAKLKGLENILRELQEGEAHRKLTGQEKDLEAALAFARAHGYEVVKNPNFPKSLAQAASQAASHAPQFAALDPEVQRLIIEQEARGKPSRVSQKLRGLPGWPRTEPLGRPANTYDVDYPENLPEGIIPPDDDGHLRRVSSSNVYAIGYRYEDRTLLVQFLATDASGNRVGPGSLYEYFQVPPMIWERFKGAGSKGKFVWDELRVRGTISGHKFAYDLAGVTGDYVPRRAQLVHITGPRGGRRAQEAYVPRAFNVGKIKRGRLVMQRIQSQLPLQHLGRSFSIRRDK